MLDIAHVSKGFGPLRVLSDLSLQVRRGEFMALLGPSGCGKTTLLKVIVGLEEQNGGSITLDGHGTLKPGTDTCMVFQQYGLFPWLTVIDQVGFGLKLQGVSRTEREKRSQEALELVGLVGFERYYPQQLSGGMQQRVGLARALVQNPKVLLMDEPFAAVDEITRETLQEELLKLWHRQSPTVLFVTHSVEEAVFLSDRVAIMGKSPDNLRKVVDISLERPRNKATRRSAEFYDLVIQVREEMGTV